MQNCAESLGHSTYEYTSRSIHNEYIIHHFLELSRYHILYGERQ